MNKNVDTEREWNMRHLLPMMLFCRSLAREMLNQREEKRIGKKKHATFLCLFSPLHFLEITHSSVLDSNTLEPRLG